MYICAYMSTVHVSISSRSWRNKILPDRYFAFTTRDRMWTIPWTIPVHVLCMGNYNDLTVLPSPGNHGMNIREIIPFYRRTIQ